MALSNGNAINAAIHFTIHRRDGRTYIGEWLNNDRHGKGSYTKANGEKIEGEWKEDRLVKKNDGNEKKDHK